MGKTGGRGACGEKTGADIYLCGKGTTSSFRSDRKTRRRICFGKRDTKLVGIQKAMYVKLSRCHIGILLETELVM